MTSLLSLYQSAFNNENNLLFCRAFAQDNGACVAQLRHLDSVVPVKFYQIFHRRMHLYNQNTICSRPTFYM